MKPIAEQTKAKVAAVYDCAAATYNRIGPSFFLHFGKRLARSAEIPPGTSVLDVATGTGAVLVPAAALVGSEGRVVGIDISLPMISRARTEIRNAGFGNAQVLVADAERLPFAQNSFDCVLCSFAIFLFSSLSSVISECRRVLRSSGRIGLVYSAGEDQEWAWYEQLVSKYGPTAKLGTERYCSTDVETILNGSGFRDVSTIIEAHRLTFTNAWEFWGWVWSHGDRVVLESLTHSRSEFKQELFEEFGKRATMNGLPYEVFAAITIATKQ